MNDNISAEPKKPNTLEARSILILYLAGDAAKRMAEAMEEPQRGAMLFVLDKIHKDMEIPEFKAMIEGTARGDVA